MIYCLIISRCLGPSAILCFFFFNDTATTEIYTLSLHDALPISRPSVESAFPLPEGCKGNTSSPVERIARKPASVLRSEEHTSELQSPCNLVCRLLLEKKKKNATLCCKIIQTSSTIVSRHQSLAQ